MSLDYDDGWDQWHPIAIHWAIHRWYKSLLWVQWHPLVNHVVNRYWPVLHSSYPRVSHDDLLSEGNIALSKAISRYRWSSESKACFKTYAYWVIKDQVFKWARHNNGVISIPENLIWLMYCKNEGVKTKVRAKEETVIKAEKAYITRFLSGEMEEELPEEGWNSPDGAFEPLRDAMDRLTSRQRKVLIGRFWEKKSLQQVGNELGLTRQRIQQIEVEALAVLKIRLTEEAVSGERLEQPMVLVPA